MKKRIEEGATIDELDDEMPHLVARYPKYIESKIQRERHKKFGTSRRLDLKVTYVYGKSRIGKTRSVRDKYGDENVYKCKYSGYPFDNYNGQDVVLFDEFRSQIRIEDMLNFLDVYPQDLSARYADKVACFTKVYIISNWKLKQQYSKVQHEYPEDWQAFVNRIHEYYDYGFSEKIPLSQLEWKNPPHPSTNMLSSTRPTALREIQTQELPFA